MQAFDSRQTAGLQRQMPPNGSRYVRKHMLCNWVSHEDVHAVIVDRRSGFAESH